MKRLTLLAMTYMMLTGNVLAADGSKLRIEIAGNSARSNYVCISGTGCVNIAQASRKTLPIMPGSVDQIFLTTSKNYRMYPQNLPHSCNVTVNPHQTLVVSGRVAKAAHHSMYISALRCSVVNS